MKDQKRMAAIYEAMRTEEQAGDTLCVSIRTSEDGVDGNDYIGRERLFAEHANAALSALRPLLEQEKILVKTPETNTNSVKLRKKAALSNPKLAQAAPIKKRKRVDSDQIIDVEDLLEDMPQLADNKSNNSRNNKRNPSNDNRSIFPNATPTIDKDNIYVPSRPSKVQRKKFIKKLQNKKK